jgi:hypothetical protein
LALAVAVVLEMPMVQTEVIPFFLPLPLLEVVAGEDITALVLLAHLAAVVVAAALLAVLEQVVRETLAVQALFQATFLKVAVEVVLVPLEAMGRLEEAGVATVVLELRQLLQVRR